jgi:tubulin alpha
MPSTYVITGASSGIGLELVKQLAARGDKVFATVRSKTSSASGIDLISAVQGDVTIIEGIDVMSDDVGNALAASPLSGVQIDCLVNNAGSYNATRDLKGMEGFQEQALANISAARMMHTFNLNCCGVLRVTQALLPQLVPGSKIAVVSSGMGSIGDNGSGGSHAYRVSKAAVNMLTKGMSCDLKEKNIAVVAVNPGMVATDFGPGAEAIAKMGGKPVENTCTGMLQVFDGLSMENTGKFMSINKEFTGEEFKGGW